MAKKGYTQLKNPEELENEKQSFLEREELNSAISNLKSGKFNLREWMNPKTALDLENNPRVLSTTTKHDEIFVSDQMLKATRSVVLPKIFETLAQSKDANSIENKTTMSIFIASLDNNHIDKLEESLRGRPSYKQFITALRDTGKVNHLQESKQFDIVLNTRLNVSELPSQLKTSAYAYSPQLAKSLTPEETAHVFATISKRDPDLLKAFVTKLDNEQVKNLERTFRKEGLNEQSDLLKDNLSTQQKKYHENKFSKETNETSKTKIDKIVKSDEFKKIKKSFQKAPTEETNLAIPTTSSREHSSSRSI